ncbi:MAG: hypothetical protein ABGX87_19010 [Alcanivorax sp.]
MLNIQGQNLYIYSITRDLGFAPNPFHGVCTLATCKPKIRAGANVGDWVIGLAGHTIKGHYKKCIFIMQVSERMSFTEYWNDERYQIKKPVRNGSKVQMLGDNIYCRTEEGGWWQSYSHHSNPDGSINEENLRQDTSTDRVLTSDRFIYFGREAVEVDVDSLGYAKVRDCRKFSLSGSSNARNLVSGIIDRYASNMNLVVSDPFHFDDFNRNVDQATGKYL